MRKVYPVLILFFVVASFEPARGEGDAPSPLAVRIEAEFLPEEHVILGQEFIRFDSPPAELWFLLLGNFGREKNPYLSARAMDSTYVQGFDPAWTKIGGVVWSTEGGETPVSYELLPAPPTLQTYSLDDVLMRVALPPEELSSGEGELRIDFRTRFPAIWAGEPGRIGDFYTWRFGWHPIPTTPPEEDYWPYIIPAHLYQVELSLPTGWDAFLPGTVEKEGKTIRAVFDQPVRSISLFFAKEDAVSQTDIQFSGLTLSVVSLPGDEDKMLALAAHAQEIMRYYAERYGPYPHDRLLLIEHPNETGVAMSADGVAYLPRYLFTRMDLTAAGIMSRYAQFILAHELAHQWWGVGVGVDFDAENWLSEGLSQYASISWFENTFGADGGNLFQFDRQGLGEEIGKSLLGYVNLREHLTELPYLDTAFLGFDEAVVKPTSQVRYLQENTVRLYDKGYLVLRSLAHLIGEEGFREVLRSAYESFRAETMTVDLFQAICQAVTDRDLQEFFAHWVHGEAESDYQVVDVVRGHDGLHHVTTVRLRHVGEGFLPVEVEVRGEAEERAQKVWEAGEEVIVFQTTFLVREVVVDPGHYALDVDRLNNVWPTRLIMASGNDYPLDAYLVRAGPPNAVIVTYLDRFGWAIYPEFLAVEGFARYGREGEIRGFAQVAGTLVGELTLTRYLWGNPSTGMSGMYWEESGAISLTLFRGIMGDPATPYFGLGLNLGWQGMVNRVYQGSLEAFFLPGSGGRFLLTHTEEMALAPHVYLDLGLGVGMASPALPAEQAFTLSELNLFLGQNAPWPSGRTKLVGSLSLWLPSFQPDYHLGGLALIAGSRPRFYLTAGRVCPEVCSPEVPTYAEVGGEVWTTVEFLGGTLALQAVVGLVWPLGEGPIVVYYGFGF